MADLETAISAATSDDTGVRTGTVSSISPLVISLQGGVVNNPGSLKSYIPAVGDTVALLRQGDSWLCLGAVSSTANYFSQQILTANTAMVTFSNIPPYLARLEIFYRAANTLGAVTLRMRINGDGSVSYSSINLAGTGASVLTEQLGADAFYVGVIGNTLTGAGVGTIWINDWNQYTIGSALHEVYVNGSNNATNNYTRLGMGNYTNALTTPRTSINLYADGGGNLLLAGSLFRVEGYV